MGVDTLLRNWIMEILKTRVGLVAIAVRQRAKFEGWLKFELAGYAASHGASAIEVEAGSAGSDRARCDLAFCFGEKRYEVELKTCTTNWRMAGVTTCTRPITNNVAGVVADARKLQHCAGEGIVAFCMFPVRSGGDQWEQYLARISAEVGVPLSVASHTDRVSVSLGGGHEADIIVVVFVAPKGPTVALLPGSVLGAMRSA